MKTLNHQLKQSIFFKQSVIRKLKYNIFYIIIIYFSLWLAGYFMGQLIANQTINVLSSTFTIDESLIYGIKRIILCGIQMLFFFIWVRFVEKRRIKTMGFKAVNPLKSYLMGFLFGFIAILSIIVVLFFFGMVEIESYNMNFIPLLFGVITLGWIVQSASEEIAIRGWLIPLLGNHSNPIMAILLTSIIFGILHLFSSGVTVLSFANLVLSGIFFAEYAIYSNNIWGVCGLHFSWNLTLGNIYGLPISGFPSSGETVLVMKQVGSTFFTGGNFGPEGGFITTIILLIGISTLTFKLLRKSSKK